MSRVPVAILGSGNIGSDLLMKALRSAEVEPVAMAGVDPASDGLARAKGLGLAVTDKGVEGFLETPEAKAVGVAFDATSAAAHLDHRGALEAAGIRVVDLTPSGAGPCVVPPVNLDAHADAADVSMVSCGGQATVPVVAAVAGVARVPYAEIVSSIASKSAGPGTRANIDEFTATTSSSLVEVGGAASGKAIIILNPAEPPMIMRNTVLCIAEGADPAEIRGEVLKMEREVRRYVPGYRLKQEVQLEPFEGPLPGGGTAAAGALKVTVFLEVEGAGEYLPAYAGNLDIMTSAALRAGEALAQRGRRGMAA